jgi:thiamine pyrophosphokinase
MDERIAVITGAAPIPEYVVTTIADSTIILGVDGGLDHALAAGLHPSGLIGDLDSISADGLAWAEEHATISRHPTAKDQTDTELALIFAAEMIPSGITLIGGGDRLDHTFAALGALGMSELTSVPHIDAWWDGQHVDVVHGPSRCTLQLKTSSTLSLLALHGPCEKVSIHGVRWELEDARLEPTCGTGVSNEVLDDPTVEIWLSKGVLTIFDDPILSNDQKNPQDTPS